MYQRSKQVHAEADDSGGGGTATLDAPETTITTPAAPAAAPAAPAAAPAAPTGTAPPVVETPPAEKPGYWPADWRQTVAKEDVKVLSRLERFASPEAALQALVAAQKRISDGELLPQLGKNPTPEQLKEWRESRGIPETPDRYDIGDVGVAPDLLQEVLAAAHASNQTPEQVKATMSGWKKITQKVAEKQLENDNTLRAQAEDSLRAEWGPEYRLNIGLIHTMLDGAGTPALKEAFLEGRLADGTKIGSSPEALKFLVGLSRIQNPAGVIVPPGMTDPSQGLRQELEKINTVRKTDHKTYLKDEKMQARYRELIDAALKMKIVDSNGDFV